MSFFVWDERYQLGVQQIDDEHARLVMLLNQLHDAMATGQAKSMLGLLFTELIDYTKVHFSHEALLMKVYDYPEVAAHASEHAQLARKVLDLQRRFEEGSATVTLQTAEFLRSWLSQHIMQTDRDLADHLREKGVT